MTFNCIESISAIFSRPDAEEVNPVCHKKDTILHIFNFVTRGVSCSVYNIMVIHLHLKFQFPWFLFSTHAVEHYVYQQIIRNRAFLYLLCPPNVFNPKIIIQHYHIIIIHKYVYALAHNKRKTSSHIDRNFCIVLFFRSYILFCRSKSVLPGQEN